MVDFDPCPGTWATERVAGCQLLLGLATGDSPAWNQSLRCTPIYQLLKLIYEEASLQYMRTSIISPIIDI